MTDPFYDLVDDWDVIQSSFAEQYGIRLTRELSGMKWAEFQSLLSGLGPKTALGRIVQIRAENDREHLKHFTPEMRKMRSEYRIKSARKKAATRTEADTLSVLEDIKNAFIGLAGKRKSAED